MSDRQMIWLLAELAYEERRNKPRRLLCPGVAETSRHGGCCKRFAALPEEEQQRTGLRVPRRWA